MMQRLFRHLPFPCAAPFQRELVDERDEENDGARRHRELRDPQRRRIVALRDVVELPGKDHEAHAEPGERAAEEGTRRVAPDLQRAAEAATEAVEEERDPDVLSTLEGMREREETRRGHAVPRIRIRSAQVESGEPAHDAREHHQQDAHH